MHQLFWLMDMLLHVLRSYGLGMAAAQLSSRSQDCTRCLNRPALKATLCTGERLPDARQERPLPQHRAGHEDGARALRLPVPGPGLAHAGALLHNPS